MMDCKRGARGDRAATSTRPRTGCAQKGIAGAAKRAGRDANQGAIEVVVDGNVGALVELNCETDFVAKGDVFKAGRRRPRPARRRAGRRRLRRAALRRRRPSTSSSRACPARSARRSRSAAWCASRPTDGLLDGYKHLQNERGVVGVLVELGGVDPGDAKAREVAHDIALHIASAAPRYVVPRRRPRRRGRARARRSRGADRARRASPSRRGPRSSRASSTASSRRSALLEQPFVKDQKRRSRRSSRVWAATRRCAASPGSRSAKSKHCTR